MVTLGWLLWDHGMVAMAMDGCHSDGVVAMVMPLQL